MEQSRLVEIPSAAEFYGRFNEVPAAKVFDRPMTRQEIAETRSGRQQVDFVYFIAAPAVNMIKIGYSSKHPDSRLSGLRGSSPCPLVPMAVIRGCRMYEKALHRAFEPILSHCEWFRAEPALLDFIARFGLPWPKPDEDVVWMDNQEAWDRCSAMMDVIEEWADRRIRPMYGWPLPTP